MRLVAPPAVPAAPRVLECDLLVAGGGLGGCAAALTACRAGRMVVLSEETDWLGGQMTAQGVSALDEHPWIEEFGGTRSYTELRSLIRRYYHEHAVLAPRPPEAPPLNPGDGWVSRLCFEPRAGLWALEQLLRPWIESGRLLLLLRHRAVSAAVSQDRLDAVTLRHLDGEQEVEVRAACVLDATELGDLLPLAGAEYVTGVQSREDTGEPGAPEVARPGCQQSFTYPFVLELRPGEEHRVRRPERYEALRDSQPYTLRHFYHDERGWVRYRMFTTAPGAAGPFWTYRRIIAAAQFQDPDHAHDLSLINWPGNDYRGEPGAAALVDVPPEEALRALAAARELSLGFCYWLQTECPRDDGGAGYPELHLRPDVLATADGLSRFPYIRESRRLRTLTTVREQDIAARFQPHARAAPRADSVGVGFYPLDIHPGAGEERLPPAPTKPFQLPLGALVPTRLRNLLPACKNLGVTHITNGACRLHPTEWAVGEAAAHLALFCLDRGLAPRVVATDPRRVRRLQRRLVRAGVPLYWFVDVPPEHPAFAAHHLLAVWGIWPGEPHRLERFSASPPTARDLQHLSTAPPWARPALERLMPELLPRWRSLERGELAGALLHALTA